MTTSKSKENPVQMEPLLFSKKCILRLIYLTGFQCTEPDWKFNVLSFGTCVVMFITTVSLVYSFFISENIFETLETICCIGPVVPCIYKLYLAVTLPTQFRALWHFIEMVNRGNFEGRRSAVLCESAHHTLLLIKIFAGSYFFALPVYSIYPLYELIYQHKQTLLVKLFIPFLDTQYTWGYVLTMLCQATIAAYGLSGSTSFDLLLAMFVANYQGVVSIFECQLQELVDINRRPNTQKNRSYRRAFLRNIYIQLLDMIEYVNSLNVTYGTLIGFQVVLSSISIVVSLFSIAVIHWIGGIGIVAYSFTGIFVYCYLGTMINTQNDRICTMIYSIPWYEFDQQDKQVILNMLLLSQNGVEMWIGIFAPLNVESASNIVQKVFSYYTMMISFLEE